MRPSQNMPTPPKRVKLLRILKKKFLRFPLQRMVNDDLASLL